MNQTDRVASNCRHVVVGLFCLMAAIAYLSRNAISVFAADEKFVANFRTSDMDADAVTQAISHVMSAFFWSYALLQIPFGWLGQRFGTRAMVGAYMAACGLLTLMMGLSTTIAILVVVQILLGATQAGMLPTAMRSVADWIPPGRRGWVSGLIAACMQIGGAIASSLTGFLAKQGYSWRETMALYSIPALLWACAFVFWFRNHPEQHSGVSASELELIQAGRTDVVSSSEVQTQKTDWRALLTCGALWAINAQQFFRAAGYIFFATWFPKFLRETYGVTLSKAGFLSSLPLITILLGSTFGGWFADYLLRRTGSRAIARKLVASTSLFLCSLLIAGAYWTRTADSAIVLISCGTFFSGVAGPCAFAQTIDIAGRQVSVVFGMMNMLGNIGAAICPPVVTIFATQTKSWASVVFLFGAIYFASGLSWLFLNADQKLEASNPVKDS